MLTIVVPGKEYFNDTTGEFITVLPRKLELEHSLISVSKWESRWKKPFLDDHPKTAAESKDYVRCMSLDMDVDPMVYRGLTAELLHQVDAYINDSMTATTFSDRGYRVQSGKFTTSELIYCRMFALGIPKECETWHLNRLLTLIRVCNEENAPKKKMSTRERYAQQKALNAQRRKALGSKG